MDARDIVKSLSDEDSAAWWCDPREVIRFARVLVDADQLGSGQHEVITFFEMPWEWDDEHRMWCEAARPSNDAASDTAFQALCARFGREIVDEHVAEHATSPVRWRSWSTQIGDRM